MDNENQQDRRRRSRMDNNDDGQDGGHRDGGSGKKRPIEGGDYSGSPQKKGSFMNGKLEPKSVFKFYCEKFVLNVFVCLFLDPETVYLKFMVPQATAGSVIGKGGQNISDLQKEFNVHIRMSKANDVFPGKVHYLDITFF